MTRRFFYTAGLVVVLGVIAACGGDGGTGPVPPSATGVWLGNAVTDVGVDRWMTLDLQESGDAISGSCEIRTALTEPPYWSGTVAGTHDHPAISLQITEPGYNPLTLVGEFQSKDRFQITLNGTAGWTNTQVTFDRQ